MIKFILWFSFLMILYTYIGYPVLVTLIAGGLRLLRAPHPYPLPDREREDSRNDGGEFPPHPYPRLTALGLAERQARQALPDRERETLRPVPLASLGYRARNDGDEDALFPTVSVIIPAYNEEDVIQSKIENCLAIDYPKEKIEILIGSDGSTDKTDYIIGNYIDRGIKCFFNEERQGKPTTINELVKHSNGEILFFTDARQFIEKDALKKLVRNFQDEKIGCVSGELLYRRETSITGRGIGIYWEYEKYLREKESDIYSMIGATGAIYACRKALFEPLPEDIALDDVYIPLSIVRKGYRAIFDRGAKAYDVVAETPRQEHKRKVRTLSGNYQIFFRMSYMLNPFGSKLAFQIISHKLFRLLVPFFMIALFVSNLFLAQSLLYVVLLAAQLLFYTFALIEAVFRRRIKKLFGMPYFFCVLNYSALMGFWHFISNRSNIKWEKVKTV